MPGYSIAAAEHSTITSWGRAGEADAYANMVKTFGGEGKLVAVVSDSYDIRNAVAALWGGKLKSLVTETGGTVVIRARLRRSGRDAGLGDAGARPHLRRNEERQGLSGAQPVGAASSRATA